MHLAVLSSSTHLLLPLPQLCGGPPCYHDAPELYHVWTRQRSLGIDRYAAWLPGRDKSLSSCDPLRLDLPSSSISLTSCFLSYPEYGIALFCLRLDMQAVRLPIYCTRLLSHTTFHNKKFRRLFRLPAHPIINTTIMPMMRSFRPSVLTRVCQG